ncbi:MAG: hypothetical protein KY476_15020 [Planctomycetes bacterium]|nr:hypothetical protein [Planctomycetota bacterium]
MSRSRLPLAAALVALVSAASGCFSWSPFRRQPELPVYEARLSKHELVEHLNANIAPLQAWRSTDVSIGVRGIMGLIKMQANVAVARPDRLRLRAKLLGPEVDLGSNAERFWFWTRQSPPDQQRVFTASHEHAHVAQRMLQIPFQPRWVIEALGVVPLDAEQFALLPEDPATGMVGLAAEEMTPDGRIVRRVIVVDWRRRLIVGHHLYDGAGHLLAKASLADHRRSPAGVVLPHRIDIDWPQANLALTMTLGEIEINPRSVPEQTWQMPEIGGCPPLDLGAYAAGMAGGQ